jgi:hypothetical protein
MENLITQNHLPLTIHIHLLPSHTATSASSHQQQDATCTEQEILDIGTTTRHLVQCLFPHILQVFHRQKGETERRLYTTANFLDAQPLFGMHIHASVPEVGRSGTDAGRGGRGGKMHALVEAQAGVDQRVTVGVYHMGGEREENGSRCLLTEQWVSKRIGWADTWCRLPAERIRKGNLMERRREGERESRL